MRHSAVALLLALSTPAVAGESAIRHEIECPARLAIIYEAVQAYRRAHSGEVPRRLSELCPRFLEDPALLSCPLAAASGRFTPANRDIWTNARYEAFGSYNWEFSRQFVPSQLLKGQAQVDWHRVKTALTKSPIGDKVPIVRCQIDAAQMLNLSFSGEVYASGTYWEEMFVDRFPESYAEPFLILRDQRPIPERLPRRATGLPVGVIDLASCTNACLGDPWLWGHGKECLPLPNNVPTVIDSKGVVFELRGIVQTGGAVRGKGTNEGFTGRTYPGRSAVIRIGARCAKIHLLHATAFRAGAGENVGSYEITTKGGEVIEVPLHMRSDIDCWRLSAGVPPQLPTPWRAQIEGVGEGALHHWTWQNPSPDEEIDTVRLRAAADSVASPFLVALTIEPAP